MAKKSRQSSHSIDSVKHQDKRANIPTEELRDFVDDQERVPQNILYPRDPSLDPQLVWQGKDDQERNPLAVPAVPIYIQEKIHPQAIIEDFRAQALKDQEEQLNLFGDFNGLEFEKLIEFYQHKDGVKWANRMILGDSLLVMNSLAEKEGLKGKVQTIFLDPPYGIKFNSNWQVSTRKKDVRDGKAEDVTRQPEQIKAFRDTWQLGIHSYLAYLRDRLVVVRELLTETGSIFVQIGNKNVHLVRNLLDEVFGSENFASFITFKKTSGLGSDGLAAIGDYIIHYNKERSKAKYHQLFLEKSLGEGSMYTSVEEKGVRRKMTSEERVKPSLLPSDSNPYRLTDLVSSGRTESCVFGYTFKDKLYTPGRGCSWKTNQAGMAVLKLANRLDAPGKTLQFVTYYKDFPLTDLTNFWSDTGGEPDKTYVVQTSTSIIQRCLLMTTDPGDLVLDPTCGSGTTAYVAEQWGRRWITIDTSRVALALARTRLMSAKFDYYLLADSPEGRLKDRELTGISNVIPANFSANHSPIAAEGKLSQSQSPWESNTGIAVKAEADIKKGFVYKRVPHVTLKAIANNPDIDTIHARWWEQLEPIRTELNRLLKQSWEEWQIPREAQASWSEEARRLHEQWWKLRQERQQEIDGAIAQNADSELLYDQPYQDNKRLRVTGPFTVESLSPHRVLAIDEERPASEIAGQQQASDQFETRIIENLKKSGVQNTIKNERLRFDWLEAYAGTWLHATGEYTETDGTVRRVAISIGPEYGTVGPEQIKDAAKEAVQGLSFDLLIVCGFAFDPHVSEEGKRYGPITVLTARMNPDLLMGDELLKKTGAANLFMVFGEPDLEVQYQEEKAIVTLKGLDVYDPTTGEIRSSSTDDIACWFIDTNYNGESFFVRHAYFTGADEPYDKLKRALRAEIDEASWSALATTTSRPFDPPQGKDGKPGKIAIKVISHYGDEVLKVYEIAASP